MSQSPYIFDANAENFSRLVLENSRQRPVLANYWSPRASASMLLMPRLIRLTSQCGGRFLLALLNIDDVSAFAHEQGVTRVPAMRLYRDGRVLDSFDGEESDANIRAFIARHVPMRGAIRLYAEAVKAYSAGDARQAVRLAAEAITVEPDNLQPPIELAKLLVLAGRFDQADELLGVMPQAVRDDAEIRYLVAHLSFIRASQGAPPVGTLEEALAIDPANLHARYQLAAAKVVQNDYEGAMQQLLEIAQRNPEFRDHVGRNGLLALFQMLGDEDERVRRYRPLLQDSLH
jgi:putative thioredoxin